jgi:DNA helicase-2/ATP-dependent DNA helicase PcrA
MARVYEGYERRKAATRRLDFEDMLGLAVRLFDDHPSAADEIHARYAAFTVDEYQDVNPLQQALLERWLGNRDELCVVGDDYQTIYGFTGASPSYLLGFGDRFPDARIVRLERNYRSTPEVLGVANRLADRLGGFRKTLRATRPSGPEPVMMAVGGEAAEVAAVVEASRRLHRDEGVPYEGMAVLYRINARSEPFEEAFAAAGVPYQVKDGAFLRRPGPRAVLHRLRGASGAVDAAVESVTAALGFATDDGAEVDSAEEVTRQADLARLRALASEFSGAAPNGDVAAFVAELTRRFSVGASGRGVNLMTYHRAKGLEFDAVFLPRLLEGELPFRSGRNRAPEDEERRLLYVGITRAKRYLFLTWPTDVLGSRGASVARSPFVHEIAGTKAAAAPARGSRRAAATGDPAFEALRRWRRERADSDGVPAYVVFPDATLTEIARRRPRTRDELSSISGVGPTKLDRYADDVFMVLAKLA